MVVYFLGMLTFTIIIIPLIIAFDIKLGLLFWLYFIIVYLLQLIQIICRGLKFNSNYAISGIIYTFIQGLLNIALIVGFSLKSESLMIAPILGSIVTIIYLEIKVGVFRRFNIKMIKKKTIKSLLKYSIPLMPDSMSWWFISSFGTYFITFYTKTTDAAGILNVSNKFSTLITMLNSIFYLAWQESAINEYNSSDRDEYYSSTFNSFSRLQLSMLVIVLPIIKLYILFGIGEDFKSAWIYVPPMLIGAIFSSYASFYGTGYLSTKQTKGAFKTTIIAAISSVILNLALIPTIGLMGVPISTCLTYLIFWIIRIYDTKKFFNIKIEFINMIAMFIIIIIFIFMYYLLEAKYQILLSIVSIFIFIYVNINILSTIISTIKNKIFDK